jgi:hypothetical protein
MRKEIPDSGIMAAATATIRSSSVALMVQNRVPVEPPVSP